jgi:tetratricopeptide (TPR) repeat protein/ferredoxin
VKRWGQRESRAACAAVDHGDPALPVAGSGKLSAVRKSRRARWRAAALIAIHVVVAAHVTHFIIAGRTLSPVEPSESMYTLELGWVNAGFIFFAVALLSTLLFGRFFCGWACHIVALQDLCGYLLRRLGIRPRPLRSRLLVFVPLGVGLYMFVWPTVHRLLVARTTFPGFQNHLVTDGFWDTFPGPVIAVLTLLVCGFAAVYFLGNKGFCTYGCPYGAFFAGMDRLALGRIVVSDACDQCGHCTATCTSNVRVHEEVARHGMVVSPGCMKCLDCISVCPKEALSFRFGGPALFRGSRAGSGRTFDSSVGHAALFSLAFVLVLLAVSGAYGAWLYAVAGALVVLTVLVVSKRRGDFHLSAGEELLAGFVFVGSVLTFRGLYDGPPLLMSAGLGAITAFVVLKLYHLARNPNVRLQNLNLKLGGRVRRAGWTFATAATVWLLFSGHSAFAQWHRAWGGYWLNRTEASREDALSGAFRQRSYSERHHEAARAAHHHFSLADRFGLKDVVEVKLGLAWTHLLRQEPEAAEHEIRAALALDPRDPVKHENLVSFLLARGHTGRATEALADKIGLVEEPKPEDHFRLAGLLLADERASEALEHYRASVELAPNTAETRYNLGGLLRRMGRPAEALVHLEAASALAPGDRDTQVELGLTHAALGDAQAAIAALRRAIEIDPSHPESMYHLPQVIAEIEGVTAQSATAPEGSPVSPSR